MHRVAQRLIMPLTILTAIGLIVAWFPFSTLMNQRSQMAQVSAQISMLHRQGQALEKEQRSLSTPEATERLARQEYQLVLPGQRLIQVLDNGQGTAGDPGSVPLVSPLGVSSTTTSGPATHHARAGFWSRVASTLEFWR